MTETTSYTVGETAERTGFSIDTLRYYERLGLVDGVSRDAGGRRRYTAGDLAWLGFLSCLRDTGMPLREMQQFAQAGDLDPARRREILKAHHTRVRQRITELTGQLRHIEDKIAYYRDQER